MRSYLLMLLALINLILMLCLIGMIIDRVMMLKYFMCYELFFMVCMIMLIINSTSISSILLTFILIWNSVFELVLGLNSMFSIDVFSFHSMLNNYLHNELNNASTM